MLVLGDRLRLSIRALSGWTAVIRDGAARGGAGVCRGGPDRAAFERMAAELAVQRAALEQRNGELAELLETTCQLASELDQGKLLEKVLEGARRLLGAHQIALWLCEP